MLAALCEVHGRLYRWQTALLLFIIDIRSNGIYLVTKYPLTPYQDPKHKSGIGHLKKTQTRRELHTDGWNNFVFKF